MFALPKHYYFSLAQLNNLMLIHMFITLSVLNNYDLPLHIMCQNR